MKKLYVVDVSSMFFRAYFAIPPLTTKAGLPTNALYGFLSMTVKLLRDIRPDYLAFCFDVKQPSFRTQLYDQYKANRTEMPEDLQPQIPFVKKITDMLGIPRFESNGYEADDIIGTLAKYGRKNDLEVVIVSGDKDFAQLIDGFVSMYDTMREKRYDVDAAIDKWGVHPEQMIDYLALIGDSSDNIPGVRGVGPKTAQKLLAEYKTLDKVYENIDKISGKSLKAKLIEHKDMAYLSKELVTIKTDVDLKVKLNELKLREIQRGNLSELLQELEFTSFEKNLLGQGSMALTPNNADPEKQHAEKSSARKKKSSKSDQVAVEWTDDKISCKELQDDLEPYAEVWAVLTERGFLLNVGSKACQVEGESSEVGEILSKKLLGWKGFNLKAVWNAFDISDPQVAWDQMLAAYILKAGNIESFDQIYKFYAGKSVPDLASPSQMLAAHQELEALLKERVEEAQQNEVLQKIEFPLEPVLYEMERHGVLLDLKELEAQAKTLNKDLERLEKEIHALADEAFNIGSPKQLAVILFEKLGLPVIKKTKTGNSTNNEVLEKLKIEHPIAELVIEYRELSKLKSTYVDSLPHLISKKTGRIHTRFRQAATTTGRLSSVNPNLQNIPIRTERGRMIRKAFVAPEGHSLISADYSQIELRILAHITGDPGLSRAFEADLDVHQATASEIFGVSLEDVTSDLRRKAKAVNFGIAYGQGAFGLAETLGISRGEAQDIIKSYFQRFKKVREYMDATIEKAKATGYVETLLGRRRYIDELKSKSAMQRKFGERAAINAPIQGSASDIVKLAMIKMREETSIPMLLQVHDELLFECPDEDVDEQCELIKEVMESAYSLKVPLKVNVATGKNWEDAHS